MEKAVSSSVSMAVYEAIPLLLSLPAQRYWVDYDREADVLYISFRRPQKATDTQMTDDGILLRYRRQQLVGVTVLDASTRGVPTQNKAQTRAA